VTARKNSSIILVPLLLGGGAVAAALIAALAPQGLAPQGSAPLPPPPPKPREPETPIAVDWFGGSIRRNIDALAFMFASENEDGSFLLWSLQALAANNFAKQLGRSRQQIRSIADMLTSGIDKSTKPKRRVFGLDWGPQYDKQKQITRWASTQAGRKPMAVSWRYYEFAQRLLENKINLAGLKGRRGESMPDLSEWTRITSYLQYERFAETVIRQAGDDAETDVDKLLEKWGKPRLIADVEGVRFYGR